MPVEWKRLTGAGILKYFKRGSTAEVWFDEEVKVKIGDGELHHVSVDLTNAEIKALRASPKELVAAPGAGKYLELVSAMLILNYGSDALTESVDNMVIQYHTSGIDATGAIEATNFIDATADTMLEVLPSAFAYNASTNIVNLALELFNTGDGEYGGNASLDTTMRVNVAYRVWETGL